MKKKKLLTIALSMAEAAGAVDHIDGRFAFPAAGAIVGRADGSAVCIAGVAVWDQLEDAEICSAGQHSGAGGADRLSQFFDSGQTAGNRAAGLYSAQSAVRCQSGPYAGAGAAWWLFGSGTASAGGAGCRCRDAAGNHGRRRY